MLRMCADRYPWDSFTLYKEKLGLGGIKALVESDNAQSIFSVQAAEAAPANKDPLLCSSPGWVVPHHNIVAMCN